MSWDPDSPPLEIFRPTLDLSMLLSIEMCSSTPSENEALQEQACDHFSGAGYAREPFVGGTEKPRGLENPHQLW